MTIALTIPPLTMKNRRGALIRDCALNQANTVVASVRFHHERLGFPLQQFDHLQLKQAGPPVIAFHPVCSPFAGPPLSPTATEAPVGHCKSVADLLSGTQPSTYP